MRYTFMRLFLTRRKSPPLLEILEPPDPRETRSDYLHRVLESEIRFQHRRASFVYRYFRSFPNNVLAGVIARETRQTIGLPPEEQFRPREVSDWETANIFIDVAGHADGQKVAIQQNQSVGSPVPILQSLVAKINSDESTTDWILSGNPIASEQQFWAAVSENRGRISQVEMTFIPPNIWGGTSETEKALRELANVDNATEIEVTLRNPEKKLDPSSDRVKESVDYIVRGGGDLKLKSGSDTLFSSESQVETASITDDAQVQEAGPDTILSIIRRLFGK